MPTYEYKCTQCDHQFDVFQSMTDEPVKTCEKCGGEVRKLFGTAGIIFKGSGFYVNDYKSGSPDSSSAGNGGAGCNGCCGGCDAAG
jgi:putative FmdB family regulatory protein